MSDMIKVSICDGKYTIIQDASGRTNVLRYGESWRDATGDNVVLGAAYEIEKLQFRIKRLEDIINRASLAFFSDSSHRKVSIAMHTILEEFRRETKS